MDLIYSVGTTPVSSRKGKNASNVERALGAENLCQISSGNVIAFSASGGPEEGLNVPARGYHVFVADLNTPWDIHLVWSGSSPVSCLEWDATGTRLLVGHVDGLLQMLQSPGHVINSWHVCPHSVRVDNEQIVQAIFFHNGKKISIASDKKDSFLYNDKFQNTLFCPTLRHFGGRPTDGFIGVTSSGLLAVCAFNGNGSEATIKKFELSKRRSFVRYASMAYSKNGDVMVACSAGLPDAPVTVHQVSLRQTLSELSADVQQLPSVYLDCGARPDSAGMQSVACLRYLHKEDPSQLLVAAAGDGGGVLELWQLGEVPVSFGPIFKHLSGAEPRVQTWLKSASYQSQRPLSSIGTARVCLQDGGLPAPPIVTTMSDGGIVSLHRDSMAQMGVACAEPAPRPAGEPPLKLARSAAAAAPDAGVRLTDVALSSAGHLAAAVDDRGQLYLYRVTAAADPGGLSVVSSLVLQLEYYMVTGLDVWDLLVGLRSHLAGGLEAVCETLADTFHRQPGPVQQYYYVRHMAIKTSLYRLLSSGGRRVSDNNALLMLRCVASAFRALLRPAESSPTSGGGEAEPSEPLTALMASKPVEAVMEIDKVLAHLKERDAGAAADAASLAQLQHLAQWVTDLCLQGIATLADGRHKQVAVLRERQSLLLLRELLVMIRRWGAARPACLPVFHRGGDHTDVIALLFKLLTRLLSMHGAEPDEAFINEVSLLPAPGLAEHWSLDLPPRGVVAACVSASPSVRHYCYYDWEGAESSSSHRRHQEQLYTVDALRYLRLGARPSNLKHCTRCLAVTSARSSEQLSQVKSTPLTRAWDQRWTRACLCGGRWALQAQRPPGRARVM